MTEIKAILFFVVLFLVVLFVLIRKDLTRWWKTHYWVAGLSMRKLDVILMGDSSDDIHLETARGTLPYEPIKALFKWWKPSSWFMHQERIRRLARQHGKTINFIRAYSPDSYGLVSRPPVIKKVK